MPQFPQWLTPWWHKVNKHNQETRVYREAWGLLGARRAWDNSCTAAITESTGRRHWVPGACTCSVLAAGLESVFRSGWRCLTVEDKGIVSRGDSGHLAEGLWPQLKQTRLEEMPAASHFFHGRPRQTKSTEIGTSRYRDKYYSVLGASFIAIISLHSRFLRNPYFQLCLLKIPWADVTP